MQDRALLYENIGATKELGAEMRSNQENLTAMHKRSQGTYLLYLLSCKITYKRQLIKFKKRSDISLDLKTATHKAFTALGKSLEYLLTEAGDDSRDDIASSACYCTLFGLGPAWTVYVPPLSPPHLTSTNLCSAPATSLDFSSHPYGSVVSFTSHHSNK